MERIQKVMNKPKVSGTHRAPRRRLLASSESVGLGGEGKVKVDHVKMARECIANVTQCTQLIRQNGIFLILLLDVWSARKLH